MKTKKRHSPWFWIPMLCAAEEIPCTIVTYVAILMLLQFGASISVAAIYCGLLMLPWVMKSYFRSKVRKQGFFKRHIHIVEAFMFLNMMTIAMYINDYRVKHWALFIMLFVLSALCAWHELLSRMYYNRMLYPRQQRIFNKTRTFASQMTMVLSYGVLIILVGFFEVFFRSYQKAWAMECSLMSGVFFLFFVLNFFFLQNPRVHNPYRYESLLNAFKNEVHVIERIRRKPQVVRVVTCLFATLLPQALMFNGRVFFLLASADNGGLDCTIQDVGFAQGTIGVIAFSVGLFLGRILKEKMGYGKIFHLMSFVLTLSPVFYMAMSQHPLIGNLQALCCMTFLAQLCFGFGLNICMPYVYYISDNRYRNSSGVLFIPLIVACMIVPMALTGLLVTYLGFKTFFIIDAACAPLSWILILSLNIKELLLSNGKK